MTQEKISPFDAISTQRAIRRFTDKAVSDEAIETILSAAPRAPSGGNLRLWRFIVIRDVEIKRRLGELYLSSWQAATAGMTTLTQPY